MAARRTALAGLIPIGFETFTLSNSTAQALNSTSQGASVIEFSVETNNVRMRNDGTDPTLTTGVLFYTGVTYRFDGYDGTSVMKFQRSTGTAKVSINAYRHAGGDR